MSNVKMVKKEAGLMAELSAVQNEFGGFIDVRKDLIKIPRLQLGQAMSDTVQAGLGKVGEFLSKVKGKNYGTSVKIVPLLVSESAAYLDKKTSKLICRSDNLITNTEGVACKDCPHGQYWNSWTKDNVPECKNSIDIICIVNDEMDMPQIISFRKTSYKAGRAIVNLIMHDKFKVPFGSSYTLKSAVDNQDDYKFYIIEDSIAKEQLSEDKIREIMPVARQLLEMKKSGRIEHEVQEVVNDTVEEVVEDDTSFPA